MPTRLQAASSEHVPILLPLIKAYHAFEGIGLSDAERVLAVEPLLGENDMGRIWLINHADRYVGYIVLCFGYSIEFKGRDAFLDEFFIEEPYRGKGIGGTALAEVISHLAPLGIKAVHLEVGRDNKRARQLYADQGFVARERFTLMSLRLHTLMKP